MTGIARVGDLTDGICYHPDHSPPLRTQGRILTSSGDVNVNNRPIARAGDLVQADCGHISKIITSSPDSGGNSKGIARLNDLVGDGPYEARIVTGSPDTSANG